MAKYNQDIKEMLEILTLLDGKSKEDYAQCVSCLTAATDEEFLEERAAAIKEAVVSTPEFLIAIRKLANICMGVSEKCESCTVRKYCNAYIMHKRVTANESALQMVDLFCGAGGLSLGFTQEGFMTALANDIEPCCVDTYAHNHPETPRDHVVLGDIREVVDHLEELLKDKDIDIVVGGPRVIGFNIHYYPPRIRFQLMNRIYEIFKPMYSENFNDPLDDEMPYFNYKMLMDQLQKANLDFGIREYIPNLMAKVVPIPVKDWPKAVLTEGHFRKETRQQILNYWRNRASKLFNTLQQ